MESLFRCLAWVLTAVLWTVLLGVPLALQIPPALAAPWVLISLAAFAWLYLWRRDPAARRALWRSFRLTPTHLHFSWLALVAIATTGLNVSCALLLVPQSESSGAELIWAAIAIHVVNNGVALLFFQTAAPPSLGAPYALLAVALSGTSLALALRGLAQASRAA